MTEANGNASSHSRLGLKDHQGEYLGAADANDYPVPMSEACPLCLSGNAVTFHEDTDRSYCRCPACALVFVPERFLPDPLREKAEYDLHQNDPDDPGYRAFLGKLAGPMIKQLPTGARGIDFGCGPGPAMAMLFEEAGLPCANYDPFYRNEPALLEQSFDFIACSEVIEHCHDAKRTWELLLRMLKPGGVLGVMTQWVIGRAAFSTWRYPHDITHTRFYSWETMDWIAAAYNLQKVYEQPSVMVFAANLKRAVGLQGTREIGVYE